MNYEKDLNVWKKSKCFKAIKSNVIWEFERETERNSFNLLMHGDKKTPRVIVVFWTGNFVVQTTLLEGIRQFLNKRIAYDLFVNETHKKWQR